MNFVDSHCHLNADVYQGQTDSIVQAAQAQGITTLLSICTKVDEAEPLQALTALYPGVYASVGIHPHEAKTTLQERNVSQLNAWLRQHCGHPKVVCIGETGLDFYYEHSLRMEQLLVFQTQMETALEVNLPLSIHTRSADKETITFLKNYPESRGVIHCFSGSAYLADEALALGYYISISGIATFKKAEEIRDIIKTIPLDRLLLETDAPYLAPLPVRGQQNQPAWMIHTAQCVADLKEISLSELAQITSANFFTLFSKATSTHVSV